MFVQNLIQLSAAVHELSCLQRETNSAENNTALAFAGSSKTSTANPEQVVGLQQVNNRLNLCSFNSLGSYQWGEKTDTLFN